MNIIYNNPTHSYAVSLLLYITHGLTLTTININIDIAAPIIITVYYSIIHYINTALLRIVFSIIE